MEHFILYSANHKIEAWEGMDGEVKSEQWVSTQCILSISKGASIEIDDLIF